MIPASDCITAAYGTLFLPFCVFVFGSLSRRFVSHTFRVDGRTQRVAADFQTPVWGLGDSTDNSRAFDELKLQMTHVVNSGRFRPPRFDHIKQIQEGSGCGVIDLDAHTSSLPPGFPHVAIVQCRRPKSAGRHVNHVE